MVDDAAVEGTETATIALSYPSSGIILSGATQNLSIDDNDGFTYYSQSKGLHTAAIWATTPVGVPGTAVFNNLNSFVVQTGNTVTLNASGVNMKNLTVDNGGKFFTNTSGTNRYINLYGDILNNGIIGDGAANDGLCLNIEAANTTISGSGVTDLARIRKNKATVLNSTLTHVGRITGLLSMWVWAVTSPLHKLFGWIADKTGSYDEGLVIAGLAPWLGVIAMKLLWDLPKGRGNGSLPA